MKLPAGRFACRPWAALFFLACAVTCAASFYFSAGKPFTLDEAEMAQRSQMIRDYGPKGPEKLFGEGSGEAIPHPPMYEYSLALVFRLFGENEAAGRGFGAFCYFLAGVCFYFSLRRLVRGEPEAVRAVAFFAGFCLYLVNPLVIQHVMLIDSDAAYSFLFLNVCVCVFLNTEDSAERGLRSRGPLALAFMLLFLSKEGTPILCASGIMAYRLAGRQFKKAAADLAAVAAGAAMAWTAWLLLSHFAGIDPWIFIRQQYGWRYSRIGKLEMLLRVLPRTAEIARWPLLWVSPPFWALLGAFFVKRLADFVRERRTELLDAAWLVALAVWIPYFFIKPSIDMMKYQHPSYPLLMLVLAAGCGRLFRRDVFVEGARRAAPAALVLAAVLTAYHHRLGDYLLDAIHVWSWAPWRTKMIACVAPAALAAAAAPFLPVFRKDRGRAAVALALLFSIFPAEIALAWHQTAPYTTAESWLNYGEKGLRETAAYLAPKLQGSTPTAVRKDVLYYLARDYGITLEKNRRLSFLFREAGKKPAIAALEFEKLDPPSYVTMDLVSMMTNPMLAQYAKRLPLNFVPEKKIGDFTVLRHKGVERV